MKIIFKLINSSILLFLLFFSCSIKYDQDNTGQQDPNVRKTYDPDGNLKAAYQVKDGKIEGKATTYYPNGRISAITTYREGIPNGIEKKYYRSGELYRVRNYQDGVIHGTEKRYYRNGKLKSSQKFEKGNPSTLLEEYTLNGDKINDYPEIEFSIIRERDYKDQVLLLFKMSDNSKNVIYNSTGLIDGKYFDNSQDPELSKDGMGEIWIKPGYTGSFTISARVVRSSRALFVTEKSVVINNGHIQKDFH